VRWARRRGLGSGRAILGDGVPLQPGAWDAGRREVWCQSGNGGATGLRGTARQAEERGVGCFVGAQRAKCRETVIVRDLQFLKSGMCEQGEGVGLGDVATVGHDLIVAGAVGVDLNALLDLASHGSFLAERDWRVT